MENGQVTQTFIKYGQTYILVLWQIDIQKQDSTDTQTIVLEDLCFKGPKCLTNDVKASICYYMTYFQKVIIKQG